MARKKAGSQTGKHNSVTRHKPAPALTSYLLSIALTIVMVVLRWALIPFIGSGTIYLTIFPATTILAVTLGIGPGLAGSALGIVLIEYVLVEPAGHIPLTLSLAVRAGIMLLTAFYIGLVGDKLRAARMRAEHEAESAHIADTARREAERQADESLRESEAKYRNLFENIEEMVTVYQIIRDESGTIVEGKLTDANPAFLKVVGASSIEDVRGKTSCEILGKHWSDSDLLAVREAMDAGKPRFQEVFHPESGRYYITSVVPLDANSYLGTGRDITERRQAEAAVQANAVRLASVLDTQREIARCDLDYDALRQFILERLSRLLAAEGATLEVTEGDELVNEASTGLAAGVVGMRWKMAESFSGLCMTSNQILRTDDAESDPRVDCEASRRFGLRSMIALPLQYDQRSFGVLKLLSSRVGAFTTDTEETLRLMGEFLGVTLARQRAQAALREHEQRLRLAMQGAGGAAWDWDIASGELWWSQEMYALWDVDPQTAMKFDDALVAIHEDDRERVRRVIEEAIIQRTEYQCEHRIRTARRGERWIAAHGSLLYNSAGAPIRLMGVCFDISERKQTELELERLRNLLAEGQKIAHLGSWEFVAASHETVWSDEQKRIYGLDPAEPSPVYEVMLQHHIHPDDAAELDRAFKEAFSHGSEFDNENRIVRPDGSVRVIHNRAVPFFDEQGKLVRYVGATLDITDRKQTENALKELNEELERKVAERTAQLREKDQMLQVQSRQAAMGEMIGNIAHQWRQPLNNLGLAVQELLFFFDHGKLDRAYLEKNVKSSMQVIKHMSNTIEDFRNYFKPDKEKADFRLNDAIARTLALVEDSLKNRNVRIVVNSQDDLTINGYFNEFGQVLLNILNNAMDVFTERSINEPEVIIATFAENGKTVLTITDNAGGIPEAIIGKIFDPYFTTRGPQQGTGIGLYMAKSIIEKNMGGRLSARNTAVGAEFRIEVWNERGK